MGEQEHRHHEETAVLYSSEKLSMDYVTLAGINTRTGVAQRQLALFVVKELIDNALDDLEKKLINTNRTSIAGPQARIYITKGRKYVEIRVQNSNGISGFTQNTIKSIFDFGRFYSSKRNQFKICRGALGDALKEVSCIPHALADHHGIEGWNEPLTIRSGDKSYLIRLIVDKVKQTIHSEIQVKEKVHTSTTQVEVRIPNVKTLDIKSIEFLIIEYALLNPHIHFQVESKFEDVDEVNKPEQANPTIIDLPNTAEKIQAMSNLSSIYYYSPSNFHRLILGSSKQTDLTPAYDVMKELFREASNLKKDQALATLSQLKSDLSKRKDLYCKMRSVMKPKSKLDLLFDVKDRQESIKKTIECLGYEVADIKYKRKHGYYESEDGSFEFPFFFEVAIVNTTNLRRNLLYIEGINSSPQHYYQCLQGPPDTFIWQARNKKKSSSSILEMLERYGYSYDNEKCKKPRCIVIVNLISPRVEYKSYGKSDIHLEPFAHTIAETVYKTCSCGSRDNSDNKPLTAEALLTSLLNERLDNIQENPNLKYTDRWTQSTVFYRLRPNLIAAGINVSRRYITSQIRKVCEEKLSYKREELGIIAADRAQFYFRGEWRDVGLDELPQLKHMGTDLLIIEKEGVAEVLAPFADKKGIALLNTRGFLTEYATILSELAKKNGCNVAILTDFDASGLLLAKKVRNIYRVGIDFSTLYYFGLTPTEVQEAYKPDNNHMKPLKDIAFNSEEEDEENYALTDCLKFVKSKRIEIDSVLAKVGNPRFWDFIIYNLNKKFPRRDYNRSVKVPEYVILPELEDLAEKVNHKVSEILATERQQIVDELSLVQGFIDTPEQKEEEIKARLQSKISSHKDMQPIITRIRSLIEESRL